MANGSCNQALVPWGTVNFVSLDFVSGNIEILGKQNSLFPLGPLYLLDCPWQTISLNCYAMFAFDCQIFYILNACSCWILIRGGKPFWMENLSSTENLCDMIPLIEKFPFYHDKTGWKTHFGQKTLLNSYRVWKSWRVSVVILGWITLLQFILASVLSNGVPSVTSYSTCD